MRKTNEDFVKALDYSFAMTFGWGLAAYLPARRVGALPPGSRRYFVQRQAEQLADGQATRRACLLHADGSRHYEANVVTEDGEVVRPTLHMSMDQGSASWPGGNWLAHGLKLRATQLWDRFHRIENDKWDALAATGLAIIRMEQNRLLTLRRGPWKRNGNHETLKLAAGELAQRFPTHENPLFDYFYDEICDELNDTSSDRGTKQHYEKYGL